LRIGLGASASSPHARGVGRLINAEGLGIRMFLISIVA